MKEALVDEIDGIMCEWLVYLYYSVHNVCISVIDMI